MIEQSAYSGDRDNFANGSSTVQRRTASFLQRIADRKELNVFISSDNESVQSAAEAADERFATALQRPLEGIVVALKDNISFKGLPMTCASRMLEGFKPLYDATVVERLRDAGAIFIGKTNMDEFAMGSSNETSAFGPVKHPLDPARVPGGSSGGSAVAVADGMCHIALGSDTGGSIRQPAAFCGTYGLKPSYGRVSRYGLVAFASSLDQIGIFSRTIEDMQAVFEVIAAHDPMDSTSVEAPLLVHIPSDRLLRVGAMPLSQLSGCEQSVIDAYGRYLDALRATGASVEDITIPHSETWIPTYFILATAEASSNLARFDGVRYGLRVTAEDGNVTTSSRTTGFGTEVKRRIMLGTYVLSSGYYDAYYGKAQKARRLIRDSYVDIFKNVDVLAMPTTPTTAFGIGEKSDPVSMWLSDYFTVSANIAGIPALSIPFGTDAAGLPIGMQLQGPMNSDEMLMRVAGKVTVLTQT
ncbi:MAG: Asp-tRNA(Asn)/Glu-tRNA(Gln) amidotransferase subunit GatA [Candidatus Kapabacteria bacterium]|nr:Asp-tRNA(Asn)/Glu-tRNA(Gln) amidotransferase subunit GatA [Candidatus Kapabacteria bacterium]